MKNQSKRGSAGTRTIEARQKSAAPENLPSNTSPSQSQIASRAYEIWQRNGYKHGRDQSDWLQAEQELIQAVRKK